MTLFVRHRHHKFDSLYKFYDNLAHNPDLTSLEYGKCKIRKIEADLFKILKVYLQVINNFYIFDISNYL